MQGEPLTIRAISRLSGLSEHTLRYYEQIGLLDPIARGSNGHRRYSERDLEWLAFIGRLRETGMPIAQMQSYAAARRQGDASLRPRRDMMVAHRQSVAEQISKLQQAMLALEKKIAWYDEQIGEDRCLDQT